ncbi:hypothetical protein ACFFJY_14645 [Fictibacillus aquaticus]|uniref:DUF1797 domain-containing protein n=1 Tax=Fictibacillus aquaticus TaxID=2021314 RepID=A0A235FDQ7_9BACL|nr:hypothetical protein [Fictibacillus aquaticus]OYD59451.1 hypothetical protein CGZ90_06060 [Fictibacillus aquaticus]
MNQQSIVFILAELQTSPYAESEVTHTFSHENQELFTLSYSKTHQTFSIFCTATSHREQYAKIQDATEAITALMK